MKALIYESESTPYLYPRLLYENVYLGSRFRLLCKKMKFKKYKYELKSTVNLIKVVDEKIQISMESRTSFCDTKQKRYDSCHVLSLSLQKV